MLAAEKSGLDRDSVVNVSQLVTLDRAQVTDWCGTANPDVMRRVEAGLHLVLGLDDG